MHVITLIEELQETIKQYQVAGKSVGLVPTMGSLHEGHSTLIEVAQKHSDIICVSIFVNPKQFGATEDFSIYPRTLGQDKEILLRHKVDILFCPSEEEMYPSRHTDATIHIDIPHLTSLWCGASRPSYFQGMLCVVNILLNIVTPDKIVFGAKDFQQALLVEKMIQYLHIQVTMLVAPIHREKSGLASSSRNAYLTSYERMHQAPLLYKSLMQIIAALKNGSVDYRKQEKDTSDYLHAKGFNVDYIAICQRKTLQLAQQGDKELVVLVAATLGKARLIDNITYT